MAGIVVESAVVKSFRLEPVDGSGLWLHEAGQYLPVRLKLPGDARPTSRVYTVSTAPSDGIYPIRLRKQVAFCAHLHAIPRVGAVIQATAPHRGFVLDALAPRHLRMVPATNGTTPEL